MPFFGTIPEMRGPGPSMRQSELRYTAPNAKRPTLADWPKCLNLLVVMGGVEPPTYGL